MTTTIPSITPLPPSPQRTDPATFSARADASLTAQETVFVPELNYFAAAVNTVGTEMAGLVADAADQVSLAADQVSLAVDQVSLAADQVSLASDQAVNAAASATAAAGSALVAGAVVWVSGTTYAVGDARYSPINLQTYRRAIAGAGTTDPSLDSVNWTPAIEALPAQSGNAGKFATTDGTNASWQFIKGLAPIGSIMPLAVNNVNPYVDESGSTWLRTGTVATAGTYPLAPKAVTRISFAGDASSNQIPSSYGNGVYIQVISTRDIYTSPDGLDWTKVGVSPVAVTAMAYGAGVWVFASINGTITTSDFVTFTPLVSWPNTGKPSGYYKNDFEYLGGIFIALPQGTLTYIYTSTDGLVWTSRTKPSSSASGVAYDGVSRYVIVSGSTTSYSTDGCVTWTAGGGITSTSPPTVAFGAGYFVVASANTTTPQYSTNGVSWTNATVLETIKGNVIWTGTRFYLGCGTSAQSHAYSTNGTSWTAVASTNLSGLQPSNVIFNNFAKTTGTTLITAYFNGQYGAISTDSGATWSSFNDNFNFGSVDSPYGFASGSSSGFVVRVATTARIHYITKRGKLFFSKWVVIPAAPSQVSFSRSAYNGTTWVLSYGAGVSALCFSSTNGTTWTQRTTNVSLDYNFAAITGVFLGFGSSSTSATRSTDGVTWTATTLPAAAISSDTLVAGNGIFMYFTSGTNSSLSYYYTSIDGTNWTARTAPSLNVSTGVVFSGTHFVTQYRTDATGPCFYTSTDAVTWTRRNAPSFGNTLSVVIHTMPTAGGYIYAKETNVNPAHFAISPDLGVTWAYNNSITSAARFINEFLVDGLVYGTPTATMDGTVLFDGIAKSGLGNTNFDNYVRVA